MFRALLVGGDHRALAPTERFDAMPSRTIKPKPTPQPAASIKSRLKPFFRIDLSKGLGSDWIAPLVAIGFIGALAYFTTG
jgi:hypothetical protein